MRFGLFVKIVIIFTLLLVVNAAAASAASVQEKCDSIRKMKTETLQKLYDINLTAKEAIQQAYGYAVFNNSDIQLGLIGGGGGNGLALINSTGGEIFMKTIEGSVGIGRGG